MIDLTKETQKIFADRDAKLAELQQDFTKSQQRLIDAEGKLRAKHEDEIRKFIAGKEAELASFIAEQEANFAELQEATFSGEAELNEAAQKQVDELAAKYQEEVEASVKAAQEKQQADIEAIGDKHRWTGMTAKQIAKGNAAADVRAEGELLGVETKKANGRNDTELNIAKRIAAKLGEME